MKFILSYFFFVFSIVLSYAQKDSLDYYEYNVDYEDLLAGGKSLGPGGYFDARWFIDGTELHQICTEKFELDPDYIDGTGFLAMIGSNGDDFVKRCMYGYVDYYGENKSVFGLSVPCYLFCFSNETVLVCRWNTGGDDINLALHKEKAYSLEVLKQYLAINPLTIYYELAVPEISYIPLSANQIKTVANTVLECNVYNSDYLRPQVKPSHLTYPVPSLVGNRTYTVVHNRKNITGSTKPIELNLGGTVVQLNDTSGKTLVKTPSTLAHSNLIFIGGESTVDHIMVLDGDWTNKPIEYFENMMGHDTDAIITIIGNGQIDDVEEQYLW